MQFATFQEAFHMAGHGPYVWFSYAVTVIVLIALVVYPISRKKKFLRQQADILRRESREQSQPANTVQE